MSTASTTADRATVRIRRRTPPPSHRRRWAAEVLADACLTLAGGWCRSSYGGSHAQRHRHVQPQSSPWRLSSRAAARARSPRQSPHRSQREHGTVQPVVDLAPTARPSRSAHPASSARHRVQPARRHPRQRGLRRPHRARLPGALHGARGLGAVDRRTASRRSPTSTTASASRCGRASTRPDRGQRPQRGRPGAAAVGRRASAPGASRRSPATTARAVHITYLLDSAAQPGDRTRSCATRPSASSSGTAARRRSSPSPVPQNADNVDPWQIVSDSLQWK